MKLFRITYIRNYVNEEQARGFSRLNETKTLASLRGEVTK